MLDSESRSLPAARLRTWLMLPGGLLFSIIALAWFPLPYLFIAACWLAIFVSFFLKSRTALKRSIWFNLAFTVVVLAALETYSYVSMLNRFNTRYEQDAWESYYRPDEFLGYAPVAGVTKKTKKLYKNDVIYDVTYTIGSDGHRITPPGKFPNSDECIIFFGDSFTIGEGVNDRESMPWIVGTLQPYKVRNFGFHGYGPHQMLSAIEHGLVDCQPRFAIFQTIPLHVARSAGYAFWDEYGPRYVMRDGRVMQDGYFHDREDVADRMKLAIGAELKKSHLFTSAQRSNYRVTDGDIELYLQIVDTARRQLVEQFPGIEFHVILWVEDHSDRSFLRIIEGFDSLSIKFTLVSDILPGFSEDARKYHLSRYDGHPTPLAHQLIAEYVVTHILE